VKPGTKAIEAMKKQVRREFSGMCVVCESTESVCAHILPVGSHYEFAALREDIVVLCVKHDPIMEKLPPRERLGWLLKQVCMYNESLAEAITERLLTLCESYTRLRGGILTIE